MKHHRSLGKSIVGLNSDNTLKRFRIYQSVRLDWRTSLKYVLIGFGVALAVMATFAFQVQAATIKSQKKEIAELKKNSMQAMEAERAKGFMARIAKIRGVVVTECFESKNNVWGCK